MTLETPLQIHLTNTKVNDDMKFHLAISCLLFWLGTVSLVQAETLRWSGYEWNVRSSRGVSQGPGPNFFSDTAENVFVDDSGDLHLKIIQDSNGHWVCAELSTVQSLGYGTYEWELSSRYDKLATNAVLGLFTYNSPERVAGQTDGVIGNGIPDTPHEIDIEFTGVWGDGNLFFTTHDPDVSSPSVNFFQTLQGSYTTHRFVWRADQIRWESFNGHVAGQAAPTHPISEERKGLKIGQHAEHTYRGPVVPRDLDEKVHMNFWLFDDKEKVKKPADRKSQEVVIHSFRFTPML